MHLSKKQRTMAPRTLMVRLAFPRSVFTKSGPGVEAARRRAFRSLDPVGKAIAAIHGWVPMSWVAHMIERAA